MSSEVYEGGALRTPLRAWKQRVRRELCSLLAAILLTMHRTIMGHLRICGMSMYEEKSP